MRFRVLAGWAPFIMLALCLGACNNQPTGPQPPTITTQPTSQTVTSGQTATFSLVATGTPPLTYQWFANEVAIAGATSPSYTTPEEFPSSTTVFYFALVKNANGSAESNPVDVTVNFPPVFTSATSQKFLISQANSFLVTVNAVPTASFTETGTLPAGVTLVDNKNNSATFAGTPTATGTFPVTITAANGITPNTTQNFVLTVATQAPTITSANATSFEVGSFGTFMVTATGGPLPTFTEAGTLPSPISFVDNKNGTATLSGSPTATGTFPITITAANGITPNAVQQFTFTVETAGAPLVRPEDVPTFHNDAARTGQNVNETILTLANVNPATFGKVGFFPLDGQVDAQPLYLSNVSIAGRADQNILFVATEHDSIYAFNADTGAILWHDSLTPPGETPAMSQGCSESAGEIGISSTPVIDRTRGLNGEIYVVAESMDASGNYFQRLHSLDVATGAELNGGPVAIEPKPVQVAPVVPVSVTPDGVTAFNPSQLQARGSLLLLNGQVYAAWSPSCNSTSNNIWITAFDAATQSLTSAVALPTPQIQTGNSSSSIQLAADASGNIYLFQGAVGSASGTPATNAPTSQGNFSSTFLKLSTSTGSLIPSASAPLGATAAPNQASSFSSSGVLVLPDQIDASGTTIHLAVASGPGGNIYILNRDSLGAAGSSRNPVFQELAGALSPAGFASLPAYFSNTLFFGASGDSIKAFSISNAVLSATPVSQTTTIFNAEGASPVISANAATNAILWAVETGDSGILHAYDATNLARELYNSSMAPAGRDSFGALSKPSTPTIANGKLFIATQGGIVVFGLLNK